MRFLLAALIALHGLSPAGIAAREQPPAQLTPANEGPLEDEYVRPFVSRHQDRRVVKAWIPTTNPYQPKGGQCLPNSWCRCSEVEVNGYCGNGWWTCSAKEGFNCRYLCDFPNDRSIPTDEECQQSSPCN